MFEQHPVPQQISSYQFRLVGDMTLKQFFQLAAGAVVGLIIYSLPLPGFLKWPFIVIAVVAGAAFAFLPIQDRPLEQWLVAFFRSIYSPNLFYWKKYTVAPKYFASDNTAPVDQNALAGPSPQMEAVPTDAATHAMETNEKNFLSKVSSMISGKTPATQATTPAPQLATTGTVVSEQKPEPQAQPVQKQIVVPKNTTVEVKPEGFKASTTQQVQTSPVAQTLTVKKEDNSMAAQFSPAAAPPLMPSQPNIVVGQVMDSVGNIVESAILEITDSDGRPVRALKSNKAGHFQIVTPLPDGDFTILIEKEGLRFESIKLHTEGKIIEPIAVRALPQQNNGAEEKGEA